MNVPQSRASAHRPKSPEPRAARQDIAADRRRNIPNCWQWHYQALSVLQARLSAESSRSLASAAEPLERHSMHDADAATDEFDHDLALTLLSAEQDALFEVEAAMKRIADGTYGVCEQSGKRIPKVRLKAVPWTRFCKDVEARLEKAGAGFRPHLAPARSLRADPATALAESEPTVDEPELADPTPQPCEGLPEE